MEKTTDKDSANMFDGNNVSADAVHTEKASANKVLAFFSKPFFKSQRTLFGLWLLIGILSAVFKMHHHNNFSIFRQVFWHTIEGKSLYAYYPEEYSDHNLYGPLFSCISAPFALVPEWLGLILWCFALSMLLYWAISYFPTKTADLGGEKVRFSNMKLFILWFCAHELLTALFMQQFNVATVALIILSFVFVEKGKDHWATLFIVIGTFVKLYGIVGLAFFFFSRNKLKFIGSLLGWSAILFVLPMLISSPEYQLAQWNEWFNALSEKNSVNLLSCMQNISFLGLVRKIGYSLSVGRELYLPVIHNEAQPDMSNWWWYGFKDLWLIAFGLVVSAISYFQLKKWKSVVFRYRILAAILMFVVLFSTGSESSGYVIALVGCCIWYCLSAPQSKFESRLNLVLIIFAFLLTSMSPSDLFPRSLRENWILPYALKALPVILIWFKLSYELIFRKSEKVNLMN